MKPVVFPQANMVYKAAPGTEQAVQDLPANVEQGVVTSCWELTPDEVRVLVQTRRLWVSVFSGGVCSPIMPAVFMPPIGQEGEG